MKLNYIYAIGLALLAVIMAGCDEAEDAGNNEMVPIELTAAQTRTCQSTNNFALGLLREANRLSDEDNVVLSPITVAMNLSMLANGADEPTARKLLGLFDAASLEELNSYHSLMMESLPGKDRNVKLKLANSIWLDNGLSINEEFRETVGGIFKAECLGFESGTDRALQTMNKWCSRQTEGIIDNFFTEAPVSETYLLSATYFKGPWNIFDKKDTAPADFRNISGSPARIEMMSTGGKSNVQTGWSDDWRGIRLPYGNGAFSLTVILPDPEKSIEDVLEDFDYGRLWNEDRSDIRSMVVKLPRFDVRFKKNLDNELASLGFDIKDSGNRYPGICDRTLSAFETMQETAITVNEEGATVASVAGTTDVTSPFFSPDEDFIVDRPFVFLIRETSTGAILFAGVVKNL